MNIYDISKLLGSISGMFFMLALLNFFAKRIHKTVFQPKAQTNPGLAARSKQGMQFLMKHHRWFGLIAAAAVLGHGILFGSFGALSLTGAIATIALLAVVGLGIFGQQIKKKRPGLWLVIHRYGAMITLVLIMLHGINKAVL